MVDVTKVTGRNELIALFENFNAGLHQLSLHTENLERDLKRIMEQRDLFREERDDLLRQGLTIDHDAKRVEIMEQIVTSVWRDGMSIYDPVIQRLVEKLEL